MVEIDSLYQEECNPDDRESSGSKSVDRNIKSRGPMLREEQPAAGWVGGGRER